SRIFPVDEPTAVVCELSIPVVPELLEQREARVAVDVRAIDDDVVVVSEAGKRLVVAREVDRFRDVLRAKRPVVAGHDEREAIAAGKAPPQRLAIDLTDRGGVQNCSASCAWPMAARSFGSSFLQSNVTFSDCTATTADAGTWKSPA